MKTGFDTLYLSEKGYVLRNQKDGFYQLAFFNFILAMEAVDFSILCEVVTQKVEEPIDMDASVLARDCVIPTSFNGMQLVLTRNELDEFYKILDHACDEAKALGMIGLFNPETGG